MTLAAHRAVEFAAGLAVALVPIALLAADATDLSPGAVIVAGFLGIVLITMGIAATREGNPLAPQSHAALDRIMIAVLLVAGVVIAFAGDGIVGALCVGAGAVLMLITFATRYEEPAEDVSTGTTTTTRS